MATIEDLGKIEKTMSNLSISVDEKFKSMETRLDGSEARITKLEELVLKGVGGEPNCQWAIEIEAMKKEIASLKTGKLTTDNTEQMENTMVIGGLRDYSSIEDAWKWIAGELWTAYGPQPCTVYQKGKDFKGIAYAKFESQRERDAAIQIFGILKKREDGSSNVWAKIDREFIPRVLLSFLGGIRWQLGEWGYPKSCYLFEEDDWSFHASGKEIFQVEFEKWLA